MEDHPPSADGLKSFCSIVYNGNDEFSSCGWEHSGNTEYYVVQIIKDTIITFSSSFDFKLLLDPKRKVIDGFHLPVNLLWQSNSVTRS